MRKHLSKSVQKKFRPIKFFLVSQFIKLMKNFSCLDKSEDFTKAYENVIKIANELKFVTEDRSFDIEITR